MGIQFGVKFMGISPNGTMVFKRFKKEVKRMDKHEVYYVCPNCKRKFEMKALLVEHFEDKPACMAKVTNLVRATCLDVLDLIDQFLRKQEIN